MAVMIPESISALENVTHGEKRVFKILKEMLPDDCIVWFDLRVDGKYPDFIILSPKLGLVVLEIKDWQIGSITSADANTYELKTTGNHTNPIKQARDYMFGIVNEMKKDTALTQKTGRYKGGLSFTYGHGVVFSRISRESFSKSPFAGTIDEKAVLFQDDILRIEENADKEYLIQKLSDMIPVKFDFEQLSIQVVNRIRGTLFKEVKLSSDGDAIFKTMNLQQEQYAKGIGYGHRVIRGVAGSGKTIVLTCRAKYLSELHQDWNILVLCFNKTLATHLRNLIMDRDHENVEVLHFHGWINVILKGLGLIEKPAFTDQQVTRGVTQITDGMLNALQKYDCILIDEGQDLAKEWLEFVVKMLRNPEHSHLLLASDGSQNIYNRQYTLKSVGINAQGRTIIMRENYRNTRQVLDFAHRFLMDGLENDKSLKSSSEDNNFIISPESSLRQGDIPILQQCTDFKEEVTRICSSIKTLIKKGEDYREICILYPYSKYKEMEYLQIIEEVLKSSDIPCYSISKNSNAKSKFDLDRNSVKLSTIHSAKGLDFKNIFLCGINDGMVKQDLEGSRKLIYVAMTRARNNLWMTYSIDNEITGSLKKAYSKMILSNEIPTKKEEIKENHEKANKKQLQESASRKTNSNSITSNNSRQNENKDKNNINDKKSLLDKVFALFR